MPDEEIGERMTEKRKITGASDQLDEQLSQLSCYTTPPKRTLELLDAARTRCPVAHSDEYDGFYLLLEYEDVKGALANHRLYSSEPHVSRPLYSGKAKPALEMDPPRHKEWRALFSQALTPKNVGVLEPQVRADVNRHIDAFIDRGSAELVKELCEPVPAETIFHVVGLDEELVPLVREKQRAVRAALGNPAEHARRQREFAEVTLVEIEKRRQEPRDDYLTYLANVEVEGRRLDDDDYVGLLFGFLGAGHHSTTTAMAGLIYDVFSSERVRKALESNTDLVPTAVEESLRLHTPFYGFFRRTTDIAEVAGVEIPKEHDVYVSWAAANRDPEVFPGPSEFRLDRGRNRHLTFGFGIHSCAGAALARMELRVAIEELLRRIPDLRVDLSEPDYEFSGGDAVHMVELPVSFAPRMADEDLA